MVRETLAATKAATFCIELPDPNAAGKPTPTGTGFFVSEDGWFVTAAHVVMDGDQVRSDIEDAWLTKEKNIPPPGSGPSARWGSTMYQWPRLHLVDPVTDIAVLKVDFERNSSKESLKGRIGFSWIQVSRRPLEEGEPVYTFGYPLPRDQVIDAGSMMFGLTWLAPRTTSAIVSSTMVSSGPVMSPADPVFYVLDKALNPGNSGGPIVAQDTGHVHAVCTAYQTMTVPQEHLRIQGKPIAVRVPSLYGIVSSLSNPGVLAALEEQRVPIVDM